MNLRYPFDRRYPITSDYRAHLNRRATSPGTDFGTPVGTKYRAIERGWASPKYVDRYGGIYQFLKSRDRKRSWMGLHFKRVRRSGDVSQGTHLADTGNTGLSTGPHLHLSLKVGGKFVNPEPYLNLTEEKKSEMSENYKLVKKGNNLHIVFDGYFVGELKVERNSGPQVGSKFSAGFINRPNGGDGGPIVVDMDPISYKVLVPGNHKTFNNRPQKPKPPKPTIPVDDQKVIELREQISELEAEIEKQAEKHKQELKEDARKDAEEFLRIEEEVAKKDLEIKDLREKQADLQMKLEESKSKGIEIENSVVNEFLGDVASEIVEEKGDGLIKKYHDFVDRFPSKKLREFLKYDLIILLGINAGAIAAMVLGIIPEGLFPPEVVLLLSNGLGTVATVFKQTVTRFYGGDDGKLNEQDFRVLKDYLDNKTD